MTSELFSGGDHRTRVHEGGQVQSSTPSAAAGSAEDIDISRFSDEATFLKPGAIVDGQFRIDRVVNRGQTGLVYAAVDLLSEQPVALKVALPSALASPEGCKEFVRAVHAARLLDHEAFVCPFDLRRAGPLLFFSMEPLSGTTLRQVLQKQGRLDPAQALWIAGQIVEALSSCDGASHGALSPEHILLVGQGRLKLLGFGSGRLRAYVAGPYCPPEVRQNAAAAYYDTRRDSYALGILLFEMLTGGLPKGDRTDGERLGQVARAYQDFIRYCVATPGARVNSVSALKRMILACQENPSAPLPAQAMDVPAPVEGLAAAPQGILDELHQEALTRRPRRRATQTRASFAPHGEALTSLVTNKLFLGLAIASAVGVIAFSLATAESRTHPKPGTVRQFAGVEMVWIPRGSFTMGQTFSAEQQGYFGYGLTEAEKIRFDCADELPEHRVRLSKGFWMSRYELTEDEWRQRLGEVPEGRATWQQCQEYLELLNGLGEGHFRLPTEAEWEYACRAGTKTAFWFGDEEAKLKDFAAQANPWGLFNVHDGLHEWCSDLYGYDYNFAGSGKDPQGPEQQPSDPKWGPPGGGPGHRAVRGGRSSDRSLGGTLAEEDDAFALRLVRDFVPEDMSTEEQP